MDFIKGIIPSNPIDQEKREKIQKIAEEVMVTFGKHYLLATKDVVLETAEEKVSKLEEKREKWERKHAKREKKRAEHGLPAGNEVFDEAHAFDKKTFEEKEKMCLEDLNNGLRCHRPRDKSKEKPPRTKKITCEIVGFEIADVESDPYINYIVTSSLGNQASERNRRYSQFKQLNKAVGKQFHIKAPFPAASSKWGGRNLSEDFVAQRIKELNAYLEELCQAPGSEADEHVLHFFGLTKVEDPLSLEIETRAVDGTLHDLALGSVVYEDVCDAMTKIIIIKIKEEMWEEILAQVPPNEKVRKAALKAANKSLDSIVAPIVEGGIRAARDTSAPVRKKLMDCLEELGVVIVKAKHDVQNKLNEAMSSVLSPIVGALSQLVTRIIGVLLPVILRPIAPTLQSMVNTGDKLIDAFAQGDEGKVDELQKSIEDTVNGIADKIMDSMKDAVAGLVGDRDKLVMNPALNGIMALLELLVNMVKDIFMVVFYVKPWFKTLHRMMQWKAEMLKVENPNAEEVFKVSDKQQDDVEGVIEDNGAAFMIFARGILFTFKSLPGKAGLFASELYDLYDDISEVLHNKFFLRFSKKFSDYMWGTLNLTSDTRDWKSKVEHSFGLAFRSAVNFSVKKLSKIVVNRIVGIIETPILNAIEKHVNPLIHDSLEPINKSLPESVSEFLDVEGMVNTVIQTAIHDSCERIVKDQENVFKQEFSVAVGFVYGAPFLPSYPPFPYVYVQTAGGVVAIPAAAAAATTALPAVPAVMAPVESAAAPVMTSPVDPAAAAMAPAPVMTIDPAAMAPAPVMTSPIDPAAAAMAPAPVMTSPIDPAAAMAPAPVMTSPIDPAAAMAPAPVMTSPIDPAAAVAPAPVMTIDPAAAAMAPAPVMTSPVDPAAAAAAAAPVMAIDPAAAAMAPAPVMTSPIDPAAAAMAPAPVMTSPVDPAVAAMAPAPVDPAAVPNAM